MKQIISKFFSRVAMIFILATVFVGTVWAQKVTSYTNIVSGTRYYIGATTGGTDYYLSVDGTVLSTSTAGTAVTAKSSATAFTFSGSGTSWTIQFDSEYYLSLKSSKDNGKVQVVENAATFTASNQSGKIRLSIGDYSIQKNNSGTQFGSYANTQTDLWLEVATSPQTEIVATPTFSPVAGTYTSAQNVSISTTTQGATIYFTTDGSTPTTSSSVYSSAITVSSSTTIKAMAVKEGMNNSAVASASYVINLPYSGDGYVRVSSLDYLTAGSKVILAARYNSTANAYYAMSAVATGKPTGVSFSSSTTSKGEEIPSSLLNSESSYYWTVGITQNGYTFTNSDNKVLGYSSSTNFAIGGDNTAWVIVRATSGSSAMVAGYEGFYITNKTKTDRGIALNSQHNYGPYSISNNSNSRDYNFYLDIFVEGATPVADPSIAADNVSLGYDATSGSIAFTIANPVEGGAVTAISSATWLTIGTVGSNTVALSCAANDAATGRSSTVTLTYTYNTNQTVTKEVTVTQAGNPNIVDDISDITETGVAYKIKGTIVAKSARALVFGDGTGYVYYYDANLNQSDYSIGDVKKVSGTMGSYNHVFQFTSTATIEAASNSSYDNTPAIQVLDAATIGAYNEGLHLSDYVQLEGKLVKSTSGNNTFYNLQVSGLSTDASIAYPTSAQAEALEALVNKTISVKGYFAGVSSGHFNLAMESAEEVVITTPSITVSPETVDVAGTEAEGTLDIVYEYLPIEDMGDFDIVFYDAAGVTTIDEPDWIEVVVAEQDPNVGEGYVVSYFVEANTGEARSAYFKVLALDGDANEVYSNLVTINQAVYVPDTAILPFEFDGGRDDVATTPGLTQEGLDTDYGSSPKLKFNNTGDWLVLKFNEAPGTLTFDIKGNSFSGGTFKVQTSVDGVTYTDLETYSAFGDKGNSVFSEEFNDLGDDVRYIKWIYTEKVSGNVALGNITLSRKPVVAPDTVELTLAQGDGGFWGTFFCGGATYQLPMGAQAFTMNADKKLYRLGDDNTKGMYIPAGVAVVIISADEVITLTKTEYAEEITVNGGANILQGSDYPVAGTGSENVLAKKSGVIGFYNYSGDLIPANKAYYISE